MEVRLDYEKTIGRNEKKVLEQTSRKHLIRILPKIENNADQHICWSVIR